MKNLIIVFLLAFCFTTFSQTIDTTVFRFKRNSTDGKYSLIENKITYYGKSAGSIIMPLYFNVPAVDTSVWRFIRSSSDTTFRVVENKASFLGKDSGTVRGILIYDISSDTVYYTPNLNGYAYKDSANTFSEANVFSGVSITRQAAVDTINSISGTLLIQADSADAVKIQQNALILGDGTGLYLGFNNNPTTGNAYSFIDDYDTYIAAVNDGEMAFSSNGLSRFKITSESGVEIKILEGSYLTGLNGDGGIKTDNIWITRSASVVPEQSGGAPTKYLGTDNQIFLSVPNTWFTIKDENGTEYLVPGYTP
ncbi:MAG: hypothetical protein UZ05_CHB002000251 [Chlorobi bacterium OLB5]|nr:MAG: hypothetical protein UZ05_CHB002000251 [Chlorobi bacterium OLB5]